MLGETTPDKDGDARDRKQREEDRARSKHRLRVLDEQSVGGRDALPGRQQSSEDRRGGRVDEPQVQREVASGFEGEAKSRACASVVQTGPMLLVPVPWSSMLAQVLAVK